MSLLIGQKHARAWFDFLSHIYDRINPMIYTEGMRRALLEEVEDGRVLDVGVGTGYTTKHLANAVGIDLNKNMLRTAKDNYRGVLVLGDAANPPFKDGSFSTVISAGSLYYFPSPEDAVKQFHDLLRDEGVLLTITPSWRALKIFVHIFSKRDMENLFKSAGFKLEEIENMRRIAYFCKGRK
ncbi:MAG: class I SAM-dependent methyltransferase [Candidatus Hydrothermarchaeales archaeon]